jgi:hypothetical protein
MDSRVAVPFASLESTKQREDIFHVHWSYILKDELDDDDDGDDDELANPQREYVVGRSVVDGAGAPTLLACIRQCHGRRPRTSLPGVIIWDGAKIAISQESHVNPHSVRGGPIRVL